ncbi:MAG: TolB family protein [Marinilabiliaceae bacterium]
MNRHVLLLLSTLFAMLLCGCGGRPENARKAGPAPAIYPDYVGVTIPAGIAPLCFDLADDDFDRLYVEVTGSRGGKLTASGRTADFDIDGWHDLTLLNVGGSLSFRLFVKKNGEWAEYDPFTVSVSRNPLDDWGLTYRRIAPGYEVYGHMGIYQRCLADFDESAIFDNTNVPGACVNCHTARHTVPDRFTFHVRGAHGATFVRSAASDDWLAARNDSLGGSMVYPSWHPSGDWCAYSTNTTSQSFHAVRNERIEVFDTSSDLFVYHPATRRIVSDSLIMTPDHLETYPAFSADGKSLYFCSALAQPIPEGYKDIKYNICRIDFDPASGAFGDRGDTVYNARAAGCSAAHPRPSYDGRFLLFTVSDYGCFPIWHRESDNRLLDLRTGEVHALAEANSDDADSWHNWSIGSHWFVFTSRRDDGLYTRLYLAEVDTDGNCSKPFMLPQRSPKKFYSELLDSYNTPDFTSCPVDFDARSAARAISSDVRSKTEFVSY